MNLFKIYWQEQANLKLLEKVACSLDRFILGFPFPGCLSV